MEHPVIMGRNNSSCLRINFGENAICYPLLSLAFGGVDVGGRSKAHRFDGYRLFSVQVDLEKRARSGYLTLGNGKTLWHMKS